jgi:hypothetical protein
MTPRRKRPRQARGGHRYGTGRGGRSRKGGTKGGPSPCGPARARAHRSNGPILPTRTRLNLVKKIKRPANRAFTKTVSRELRWLKPMACPRSASRWRFSREPKTRSPTEAGLDSVSIALRQRAGLARFFLSDRRIRASPEKKEPNAQSRRKRLLQ